MAETKTRYYHLYSDGLTVRPISDTEYYLTRREDLHRVRTRMLCRVKGEEVHFSKGKRGWYVTMAQLRQIVEACKK
jgi:hypothetical protein